MRKHMLAGVCSLVAVAGVGLAAQQPPAYPPPTQQTPPTQPAQRPPEPTTQRPPDPTTEPVTPPATRPSSPMADIARTSTTVTGCLKTWDDKAKGPSTTAASGQYVLTNVERSGAASRTTGSSFLLKTSDAAVSFSQHLNHKVEVTGTLSDSAPTSTSTAGTPDRPTSDKPSTDRDASATGRDTAASDMKLPTLNVRSLKMVSPTCGTGS
jgi:hypothetical protein